MVPLTRRVMERELGGPGQRVAGVDEAGRGALAGPVVAAACIWPLDEPGLEQVRDSKRLSPRQREALFELIRSNPRVEVGVGVAGVDEVDLENVLNATMLAMARAVAALPSPPDVALIDGDRCPPGLPCVGYSVVKGDAVCYAVAAASIVAKVTRDRLMCELHREHPEYGFDAHAGYGTAQHVAQMREHGATAHHRKSFDPLRSWIARAAIGGLL